MSAAFAVVLAIALQTGGGELGSAALQRDVVHAERTRLFLDAWIAADADARARARRTMERLRSPGAPAIAGPDTETITRSWRALVEPWTEAEESTPRAGLQRFADSLDLRARPGWFPANDSGRGVPITVGVATVHPTDAPSEVSLELWWERVGDPRGGTRARREPFAEQAFEGAGFDMYVRAPTGAPGLWRLVPVVECKGERVRGVPVEVEGVGEVAIDLLPTLGAHADSFGPLVLQRLELLRAAGVRLAHGGAPSRWMRTLHDFDLWRGAGAEPVPRSLEGSSHEAGALVWVEQLHLTDRCALLLLAPSELLPEAVFAGQLGRSWNDTAAELGVRAFIAVDPSGLEASGLDGATSLRRTLEFVAEASGDAPLVVIARGDALPWLEVAVMGLEELPFDAVIATSAVEGVPRTGLAGKPLLMLAPGGPESIERSDAGYDWVRGDRLLILDEPLLPELAREWIPGALGMGNAPAPSGGVGGVGGDDE